MVSSENPLLLSPMEFTPANVKGSLAALMYGGIFFRIKDAPPIKVCFPMWVNCCAATFPSKMA